MSKLLLLIDVPICVRQLKVCVQKPQVAVVIDNGLHKGGERT